MAVALIFFFSMLLAVLREPRIGSHRAVLSSGVRSLLEQREAEVDDASVDQEAPVDMPQLWKHRSTAESNT